MAVLCVWLPGELGGPLSKGKAQTPRQGPNTRSNPDKHLVKPGQTHPCAAQALAEKEGDGMAKMLYRKDTGEILGVHIIGLHAADLIHEASNAIATNQRVQVRIAGGA